MKRKIALAQHLDLTVIEFNNEYYTGASLEEFNEFSGSNYQDIEEIEADNMPFINWLNENCSLLDNEINEEYGENIFGYDGADYLVVTDDEADELWEQDLDNYLEECIYPELSGNLKMYFDDEKWKNDARFDGRANSLNRYDGAEDEEVVEDETYFIYRQS